ncbi:hypothetical protein PQ472_00065 [Lacticaseibacillus pabuli]|uniref:Uncharacterized protein n=1 Tax=Lacticaseibacillus pabuli TaxID=3025672 RepID=A0ABY7WTA2_9LACO|nr:hypothetical protein [Lacticaseibacillus sp. KACC 23028]WDF82673.1 hypothetical protein PQ472_00065 [Lacticaseibacillus sp. KACC 23028]
MSERIAAKLDDDIAEMTSACLNSNKLLFDQFAMDAMSESLDDNQDQAKHDNRVLKQAPTRQQAITKH